MNALRTPWTLSVFASLALGPLVGCHGGSHIPPPGTMGPPVPAGDNVVVQWNNAALDAIRTTKPGPPMTSRALAMVHTCIYDAWAAYDPVANGTRLGDRLRRPAAERQDGYKAKAISYAAFEALVDLYPTQRPALEMLMTQLGYDPAVVSSDVSLPEGVGHLAASALLAYRHLDGANQLGELGNGPYSDYTSYKPVNPPLKLNTPATLAEMPHPDHWQPLTYTNQAGMEVTPQFIAPHWGFVVPFALTRSDQFRPAPPKDMKSPEFKAEVDEILQLTANLSDKQKSIAEYWADGPKSELPPGHWDLFAQFVSHRDSHGIDDDAKMFFAMTNAVMDAGIACWEAKRVYDSCRPVSMIRYMYNGQMIPTWSAEGGTTTVDGAAWKPFQPDWFPTPPFPEYVSGHSAFSAAAAAVLSRYTGDDAFGMSATIPAYSLKAQPGAPANDVVLTWDTFSAAADEAGMSRRYGGIHFKDGDEQSRVMGRESGILAFEKAKAYWDGAL